MPNLDLSGQISTAPGPAAPVVPLVPTEPVELVVDNMDTMRRLGRSWERGRLQHEQGGLEAQQRSAPPVTLSYPQMPGLTQQGNVDLNRRPMVKVGDEIATLKSTSFNIDGVEVLVPLVSDEGRLMGEEEALEVYRRTGKHLGKFSTPEAATAYAQRLSREQGQRYTPEAFRLQELSQRIDALGGDGTGFTSWMASSAGLLGQMSGMVTNDRMQEVLLGPLGNLATGNFRGAVRSFGGPGAAAESLVRDSFEQMAGPNYADMLEAGVDPNTAYWVSAGVGTLGAALEVVGLGAVAAPFKGLIRQGIREAASNPTVLSILTQGVKGYGVGLGGEVGTEVLQETFAIAGEEMAKAFDGIDSTTTASEIADRVANVALQTFKGMALLAVPGAGAAMVGERRRAVQAEQQAATMDQLSEAAQQLPPEVDPVAALDAVLAQENIKQVWVDAETLSGLIAENPIIQERLGFDGALMAQLEDAATLGGDLTLDAQKFAKVLLDKDLMPLLRDHIRAAEDALSAAEAREVKNVELPEPEVVEEPTSNVDPFTNPELEEVVTQADRSLTEAPGRLVRDFVGHDLNAREGDSGIMRAQELEEAVRRNTEAAQEMEQQFAPVREKLREQTGDYITLYRVQRPVDTTVKRGSAVQGERVALSWTSDPAFAEQYAGVTRQRELITEEEITGYEETFAREGQVSFDGYTLRGLNEFTGLDGKPQTTIDIYRGEEFLTDTDNIRAFAESLNESRTEAITRNEVRRGRIISARVSLDDVLWITNRAKQSEFIVRNRGAAFVDETGKYAPTLAEAEIGLQALFTSAREAGMTDKQYEQYLVTLQKAADSRNAAGEKRALRAQLGEVTKQIADLREELRETARESVSQQPVYQALAGIGRERLDRTSLARILPNGEAQLAQLPKIGGRTIYTPKGQKGMDPEVYADLYGFNGADTMVFAMIDAKPFDEVVEAETEKLFTERYHGVEQRRQQLEEEIEALHNDNQAEVLVAELNALREAKKEGQLKPRLIKVAARDRLRDFKLKEINPKRFVQNEKRAARKAAQLLRKGDRPGAAKAKFQQLINFYMAQEAYRIREKTKRQQRYFRDMLKRGKRGAALPVDYRGIIQTMLGMVNLKRPTTLREMIAQVEVADGVKLQVPAQVVESDGRQHYLDMSLRDWEVLYNEVKAVEHQGLQRNKMLRAQERETRDEIAAGVADNIRGNLKSRAGQVVETSWESLKDVGRDIRLKIVSPETSLKLIDGLESLGPAYNAIKRPYDKAMTSGYLPGSVGYMRRWRDAHIKLRDLLDIYDKKEQVNIRKKVNVPGVGRISHERRISVLLNLGNIENKEALLESGEFTQAQVDAIVNTASEKDVRFVQGVWDFFEEFWPEVREAAKRRRNVDPEKVEAIPLETPHGTLRGGYYPISYESRGAAMAEFATTEDVDSILNVMKFGNFTSMMTRHGHTMERRGGNKSRLKLNLFVLQNHLRQVIYDLEVGDATIDIYKILHHKEVKEAFRDVGREQNWEQLDLWFANIVTGEAHMGSGLEAAMRYVRSGQVVSKLAFSATTTALQYTGLAQAAPLVGKVNMLRGVLTSHFNPKVHAAVRAQSGFMDQRSVTFNKEIEEAQSVLRSSWVRKWTPGETARFISNLAFYGIVKIQGIVDVSIWLAAQQQGMKMFGDEAKAREHVDRMVARTQASGIFGDRTALERGALNKKTQQTEAVRTMVPFISYFMAKTNVAYERVRATNYRNPVEIADLAVDMFLLYMVDAMAAAWLYGQFPEDEEDWPSFIAWEAALSVIGGVAGLRDVASEAEGFQGGGSLAGLYNEAGKFLTQVGQGEMDEALTRSGARLFGSLARVPGTSQIIRTGGAVDKWMQGEDVKILEFVLGPDWDKS